MPLNKGKSDKARSQNIAEEVREGKPQDQAVAIGYSIQRKAKGLKAMDEVMVRRKLASGDNQLMRAKVISVNGETLRVKFEGERLEAKLHEVNASEVIPVREIYGNKPRSQQFVQTQRNYSPADNSIGMIGRK